jgi:GDPmannose 4,6-dehydratase
MRALITGVAGQDGTLLSQALLTKGWEAFGSKLNSEVLSDAHPLTSQQVMNVDITDYDSVCTALASVNPDVVFHLAGISSVGFSIANPEVTMTTNVGGTQNVLLAIDALNPDIHLVNAASTEIYAESDNPITEDSKIGPRNPYAESKANAVAVIHAGQERGLKASNAILANHESPLRSTDFVTGKIANGVARIHCGLDSALTLGNIDVEKNWSSAKDVVEGLIGIAEVEFVGDVILANSKSTKLTELISVAFNSVGITNWESFVQSDSELKRTGDVRSVQIDPTLAFKELGWRANTPASEWMSEMVAHHVEKLKQASQS